MTFPTLLDSEGYPASNAYGLTSVPTIFLIAPDGKVKVSCMGFSKSDLEKIASELVAIQEDASSAAFPDERNRSRVQTWLRQQKLGPVGPINRASSNPSKCHSESRSHFERGEEVCPIACFLRDESDFSSASCEKQIPRSARDDKNA